MTTFAFPSINPRTSTWRIVSNTQTFISPTTGQIQTAARNGTRWVIQLNFGTLTGADRGEMQGFLGALDGQRHRFTVKDHSYSGARGALGGTPLVNGASQTGNSLITDGWPNSTAILKRGDLISLPNNELKMITADVSSDGSGNATLSIIPEIHTSPSNNDALTTVNPIGLFILATPEVGWSSRPGIFSDLTIDAFEDLG